MQCHNRYCDGGICKYKPIDLPDTNQKPQATGDCKKHVCIQGHLEVVADPTDSPNDGNDCTDDFCVEGMIAHSPDATNDCNYNNLVPGHCVGNDNSKTASCVQCEVSEHCVAPLTKCDANHCVGELCLNGVKDTALGESDIDCGGPCAPCEVGESCNMGTDCASGVCDGSVCSPPTCSDGLSNGHETGKNCGGPDCEPCFASERCAKDDDCKSKVCRDGVCKSPACADGVQNGQETGIDCGGSCQILCP
ncbi:hypothetical protein GF068_19770 [Polyangium spumosum]|uniref:Disintegrin domain-containing protein n=1 Tax=Polyangium spumosum TaxID=889282 RepID=A0A6N7PZM1_9BACT|nr:hypothetical protein [Polyangium spumosum]